MIFFLSRGRKILLLNMGENKPNQQRYIMWIKAQQAKKPTKQIQERIGYLAQTNINPKIPNKNMFISTQFKHLVPLNTASVPPYPQRRLPFSTSRTRKPITKITEAQIQEKARHACQENNTIELSKANKVNLYLNRKLDEQKKNRTGCKNHQ